jgi:hypothetical protein
MMQNFKVNERGGWIVPAGTLIARGTVIPTFSEIGNNCSFGNQFQQFIKNGG